MHRGLKSGFWLSCLRSRPCFVDGDTGPELLDNKYVSSKVYVPGKCKCCPYLSFNIIMGFYCNFEREKWSDFPRTLDWGGWSLDLPNIGLGPDRVVSMDLIKAVKEGKKIEAIKIYRNLNEGTHIKEAREAIRDIIFKLDKL